MLNVLNEYYNVFEYDYFFENDAEDEADAGEEYEEYKKEGQKEYILSIINGIKIIMSSEYRKEYSNITIPDKNREKINIFLGSIVAIESKGLFSEIYSNCDMPIHVSIKIAQEYREDISLEMEEDSILSKIDACLYSTGCHEYYVLGSKKIGIYKKLIEDLSALGILDETVLKTSQFNKLISNVSSNWTFSFLSDDSFYLCTDFDYECDNRFPIWDIDLIDEYVALNDFVEEQTILLNNLLLELRNGAA